MMRIRVSENFAFLFENRGCAPGELCATLQIDYQPLENLRDLGDHIWIEAGGSRVHGVLTGDQVRFSLTARQRELWFKHASLIVSHPHCSAIHEFTPHELEALARDFPS
jgi:hypothetical protein